MRSRIEHLLALAALFPAPTGAAEGGGDDDPPRRTARVTRLAAGDPPPTIDGLVEEAVWARAVPIGALVQSEPVEGAEPSERTEVRILFDATSLYVGIVCHDREPTGIRATVAKRDGRLNPDDRVELLFDPFLDRRNAFWFQIGPAGSRGDALVTKNGSSFDKRWDAIWEGRARITARGWEAELRIPAASINFDPDAPAWGFNLRRFIRRREEQARWSSPTPRIRFFSVANAGVLEGFEGLEQGLGLDVRPFAVVDGHRDDATGDSDLLGDAGVDLFYRVTPGTKVSLSLNTDFAETEVDERRVNLTRFSLFFPEKRDFFLEDSGAFYFGPSGRFRPSNDLIPFFSRRIGIDAGGGEIPLPAAIKLTGYTDRHSWGVLDVQTDDAQGIPTQNLFAARYSRNLFERSDVGAIVTAGDPLGGERSHTVGVDFNYRTDAFRGDRNFNLSAYHVRTDTSAAGSGDEGAWYAGVEYPNDEVELAASFLSIEDGFDPALGFVPRVGIHRWRGTAAWQPRLDSGPVRQLEFRVTPTLFEDTGNRTETVDVLVRPLGVEFESGDELRLDVLHQREVLEAPFAISSGSTIPAGSYTFSRAGLVFETSSRRDLALEGSVFGGDFYDGDRFDAELELTWRPNARFTLAPEYELNEVDLPAGDFDVHLARLRADVQFGPDVAWTNFVQWDSVSDGLGLNSRLWWILAPGSELFVVVDQSWLWTGPRFEPRDGGVAAKVGYTLRM